MALHSYNIAAIRSYIISSHNFISYYYQQHSFKLIYSTHLLSYFYWLYFLISIHLLLKIGFLHPNIKNLIKLLSYY